MSVNDFIWICIFTCALGTSQVDTACKDGPMCSFQASNNECELNPETMLQDCPKVCKNPCICDVSTVTEDTACDCLVKAKQGYCDTPGARTDCNTTCEDVMTHSCPPLDPPNDPNAHLSSTSTRYLMQVTEICNPGYVPRVAINKGLKTCMKDGWTVGFADRRPVECDLRDCGPPPSFPNLDVSVNDTLYQDVANYTCMDGFEPTAEEQTTFSCNASGQWEGEALICTRVDCGPPPSATLASVTAPNTTFEATAHYTCDPGYEYQDGNVTLTCNAFKTWEGEIISCKPVDCRDPPSSPHAIAIIDDSTYNHTATYVCDIGYTQGGGSSTMTCGTDGTWTGDLISCVLVKCPWPPTPPRASVAFRGSSYGNKANYTCSTGYELTSGDLTLTCGASGKWEGDLAVCTIVDCRTPPLAISASSQVANTTYGQSVYYTCYYGYTRKQGNYSMVCGADGQWDGQPLECEINDCGSPPTATEAIVTVGNTTYGERASYNCTYTFKQVAGDNIMRCGASGNWYGSLIQCEERRCTDPPTDPNTTVQFLDTVFRSSASYACKTGYKIDGGDTTLTCGFEEQWVGDPLRCSLVDCGPSPTLQNTDVQVDQTTYGQTADYACAPGYDYVKGDTTLTCNEFGAWIGTRMSCEIKDCKVPPTDVSLSARASGTTFGEIAEYECAKGYEYSSGESILTCDTTGKWEGRLMVCIIKDCGTPKVLALSNMSYTTTTYRSTARYKCVLGHEVTNGDVDRTCQANKTWSGEAPTCAPITCGPAPVFAGARQWTNPGEGHLLYKDKVHYECFFQEEGAEDLEWTLECGPDKDWVGDEPQCGENSQHKKDHFVTEPVEAPASWVLGVAIFSILASFIVLFIIMDIALLRKHSKYLKKNLIHFRKRAKKQWRRFHFWLEQKQAAGGMVVLTSSSSSSPSTPRHKVSPSPMSPPTPRHKNSPSALSIRVIDIEERDAGDSSNCSPISPGTQPGSPTPSTSTMTSVMV